MSELIDTVTEQLLAPHDLSPARLEGLLGIMLTHGIDEGEVFAQGHGLTLRTTKPVIGSCCGG